MATKLQVAGTTLSIDTAGGTSYSTVSDVKSITVGDETMEAGDATVLASTSRVMEYIGFGFIDGGKITFELFFHKTQFATIRTAFLAGSAVTLKWSAPLLSGESIPTSIAGSAILTKCGIPQRGTGDSKNPYTYDVEAQWSGVKTTVTGS